MTKAAEKSFIPTILLELNFSESAKRIDFCRMAYRMLNEKEQINVIERTHPFTDVDKDERELAYLYENGIIKGKSATEFYPNDSISREEAAAILCRLINKIYPGRDATAQYFDFADSGQISDWAMNDIQVICNMGIMQGMGDNRFAPKGLYYRTGCCNACEGI